MTTVVASRLNLNLCVARRSKILKSMTTDTTDGSISEVRIRALTAMANRLRRESLIATSEAGSGHPTSCMSCAELISVPFRAQPFSANYI